jgi:hypothetical protein
MPAGSVGLPGGRTPSASAAAEDVGKHLRALDVELDVPAQLDHALRERLDHVDLHHRGDGIAEGEADAADAAGVQRFQLGIGDARVQHRHAARIRAELRDRVERHTVVDRVVARLDDDGAGGADALLQLAVMRDRGVRRRHAVARRHRKARRIVDVHVAVAGVGRRLELRRLGTRGVRHRLRAARPDAGGGCERAASDAPLMNVRRAIMRTSVSDENRPRHCTIRARRIASLRDRAPHRAIGK